MKFEEGQFYQSPNGVIFRVINGDAWFSSGMDKMQVRAIRPRSNGKPYTYQSYYIPDKKGCKRIGTEEILKLLAGVK